MAGNLSDSAMSLAEEDITRSPLSSDSESVLERSPAKSRSPDGSKVQERERETSPSPARQISSLPRTQTAHRSSSLSASNSDSDSDGPVLSKKRSRPARSSPSASNADASSDSDLPDPSKNNRLQELIAKRRRERIERERIQAEQEAENLAAAETVPSRPVISEIDEDAGDTPADPEVEDKLTQQARPTRKASKKAIEEMNRETQRLNRNMQLAHQAKVKTKFSMADFAARFAPPKAASPLPAPLAHPTTSSAHASSDVESNENAETPPSSPPSETGMVDLGKSILSGTTSLVQDNDDEELPSLEQILAESLKKVDKGKRPAPLSTDIDVNVAMTEANAAPLAADKPKKKLSPRKYRIISKTTKNSTAAGGNVSDDELDIVKDRLAIFDEVQPRKNSQSRAFQNLRFLANMNNQEVAGRSKKNTATVTAAQLDKQLLKRAAEQAQRERMEKVAALKAKGIIVQTAEERERDLMEIENLLEKARAEADELRKKEKALAKAEGGELGMNASDDESEDEEWQEAGEVEEDADGEDSAGSNDEEELEISGSEDEEDDGEADEDESHNDLLDDAAEDADAESESESDIQAKYRQEQVEITESTQPDATPVINRRAARKKFIIMDDEDADEEETTATIAATQPSQESEEPSSVVDIAAAFGFGAAPAALMSPSQMFAGTMGASQSQRLNDSQTQEQDSMDLFNRMVPSGMSPAPGTPSLGLELTQHQTPRAARTDAAQPFQTPAYTGFSQASSIPTPSQDLGFGRFRSQLPRDNSMDAGSPAGTVETVMLSVPESPVQQKRGRLQRRKISDASEELQDELQAVGEHQQQTTSAFEVLRKAAAKPAEPEFDKKKSGAKNMIDEQAEESEDEYAGLGGMSDDESEGEADEMDKQLIDESDINVDERNMAAFYAEKARVENEAQTSKLYKDLMSGALRRQRGDAFDLDSDEDEQLAERRRRKQREEARKRRLLLGDEQLGKFDGNEKKEAFLRAIEDRDEADEDVDMLDGKDRDADEVIPDSQPDGSQRPSDSQGSTEALQQVTGNALKRKSEAPQAYDGPFKRPSLINRRSAGNAAFVKPTSIAEVRASVSFLVDEPHAEMPALDLNHDSDDEQEQPTDERPHFSARRTPAAPVVDRLLMRKTSSAISTDGNGTVAFVSRTSSVLTSFRGSSLLRRATTGGSNASTGSVRSAAQREGSISGSSDSGSSVRRGGGGGKKSSIAYAAREAERRAVLDGVESRRKEDVRRIAGMRKGVGLSGIGGMGGFE